MSRDFNCIKQDELNACMNTVYRQLFNRDMTPDKVEVFSALLATLSPLLTYVPDRDKSQWLQRMAYTLVHRKFELFAGVALPLWEGSSGSEWSIQEVLSVEMANTHLPVVHQDCVVTTLVLSGAASGSEIKKKFSRKTLMFLSKKMGFAKPPRPEKPSNKPLLYPPFRSPQDLLGLLWYGLIGPCESYPPRYFEIHCNSAMIKYNRDLLRRRSDGHKNFGRSALVQPQPGLYTVGDPVVPGNLPQNDQRLHRV